MNEAQRWVNQAQHGNQLAVSKLLAKYHPRLRARLIARMDAGLKARMEPEDILQQAYLQVFRDIGRFEDRGPDSFLHWVSAIVQDRLIDARRAAHRQARDADREVTLRPQTQAESCWNLLGQLAMQADPPSRVVRRREAVDALLACVSNLSAAHRRVIQLRFLEGRPVAEVAQQLHRSPGAVVALSHRALHALRRSMEDMGEFTFGA